MKRLIAAFLLALSLSAQKQEPKPAEPPEEDEGLKTKEYGFNPLQAAKEVKIGLFYAKKGKHKAAAQRFEEAVKWDPTSAEAWLNLGDAREKLKDAAGAKEAWAKYLEISPDAKNAAAVRKKLGTR